MREWVILTKRIRKAPLSPLTIFVVLVIAPQFTFGDNFFPIEYSLVGLSDKRPWALHSLCWAHQSLSWDFETWGLRRVGTDSF